MHPERCEGCVEVWRQRVGTQVGVHLGRRKAPVLLPPNVQPPLFMNARGQLIEINIE